MIDHLGDDAELYPLGVLDDDAARDVERHIAGCTYCADRVSQAQQVAASLAATLPVATPSPALGRRIGEAARPRPSRTGRGLGWNLPGLAVAAAFALACAALGWQTIALHGRLAADDLALVTVVHSHFRHVSMTPHSADPVAAKILYAPDGSWLYIIADQPGGTLRAVGHTAAGTAELGVLASSGRTATLLVRPAARVVSVELQRDGTGVASAALAY